MACGPSVAADGGLWRMSTGDTGLGTSGSGDVVSEAMAGLIARGASPLHAVGYLASEITAELPLVLRSLGGD